MRQAFVWQDLIENRRAVTTLEYALIAAFMVAIVGGAAQALGTSVAGEFRVVAAALSPDGGTPDGGAPAGQAGTGGLSSD